MIFSKFFKAKWQSKDEATRLSAVKQELDQTNSDDIKILKDIAFNDSSDAVRITALKKLNSATLYWQLVYSDRDAIKQLALQNIEKNFLTQQPELSSQQKLAFLGLTKKTSLVESWYQLEQDSAVQTALFDRLNKPSFLYTAFINANSAELQLQIIEPVADVSLLEKCAKKSTYDNVLSVINDKISAIKLAKEKPEQVKKDAQLTLSMLLALKEQADYAKVLSKREQLDSQWQRIVSDFSCLSENDQQTFSDKHQVIVEQLDKAFAVKAEAHQQALIAKQLEEQKLEQQGAIEGHIKIIDQSIANAIFESNVLDEEAINKQCNELQKLIDDAILDEKLKQTYARQLSAERKKLDQIPVIAQSVSDATHLVARIAQLAVPTSMNEFNDRAEIYRQWSADWRAMEKRSAGVLPESLKQAHQEIKEQWRSALAPFEKEQTQLLNQVFKKLSDVKRLIRIGKYNASFGVYKHAKGLYEQLTEQQKAKVSRDYEQVSEKIADLSDWEHYVATPRKQELLEEVKAIARNPHNDLSHQANLVKSYRKTWNSLGHAEETQEQALNDAFNEACEQAFAPCRTFFEEQEKQRDNHYAQRVEVINQLKELSASINDEMDMAALDKQYAQLKKRWQTAGDVDRKRYQVLLDDYRGACKPINDAINHFQHKQASAKNELINHAKELLALEDAFAAANQVKTLQKSWKDIGFAGKNQENKLWQAFRKVNDEIFAKRDAVKQTQQDQNKQLMGDAQQRIEALVEQANASEQESELKTIALQLTEVKQSLPARSPQTKTLSKSIADHVKKINDKAANLRKGKQQRQWTSLFAIIAQYIEQGIEVTDIEGFDSLPGKWQRKLQESTHSQTIADRNEATLTIEILAGVESPSEFQARRLEVQVSLMQSQMTSGGQVNLTAQFFDWLTLGQLGKGDLPYLNRLQAIYC
ncbi:DUF349 domain-containing protein [Thalassotalea eurytherma]|uniref:DUF349 domain-containing protein n=1 Tax=Thalassotalea eurytherma TaxID=1144278 RepID=A0ABQ6H247_9GAMM|nr:DUF349 domain-containing protein [Thalassotalea eurytherma]GLX82256.1 hypothetical protein theurythT_17080 [Thalassotalea eurytherma]